MHGWLKTRRPVETVPPISYDTFTSSSQHHHHHLKAENLSCQKCKLLANFRENLNLPANNNQKGVLSVPPGENLCNRGLKENEEGWGRARYKVSRGHR